ncbi:amidohydrolase family protein [Kitasatospora sp. NPDC056446]|uniref:amidohydrolase family protein n=1 Tax=Kitasatospora sp. NPDC056446 TaxID=3345819 RepID=UPI00367D8D4B
MSRGAPRTARRTVLTAARVLPGPAGEVIHDGAVLVEDTVIRAVGPRSEVDALAGPDAERSGHPDGTILPGLVDGHVHLAFDAGPDPVATLAATGDDELYRAMAGRAAQLLASGVTTVRDLGDRGGLAGRLRDAVAAGRAVGPRILSAGAPLTPPGGHCWFFGGEAQGGAQIRDVVRRNLRLGADLIKVMATGGHLTAGGASMWESQYDVPDLALVVEEAHRAGRRVAAHAHGTDGVRAAVAAGVDTVEHCTLANADGFDAPDELARELARKGIAVCTAISADWRNYAAKYGDRITGRLLGRIGWLEERGVRLVAGTDAGIPGAPFDDFVGSLELFEHLGFTPSRTIELATVDTAAALGLAERTGRIAPGLDADLLVVAGDPTRSVAALRDIELVVTRGTPHRPRSVPPQDAADQSRPRARNSSAVAAVEVRSAVVSSTSR